MELGRVFFTLSFLCGTTHSTRILENNMDVGSESDALHVFGSLWCSAISNILQKRKSLEDPPEPSDSWASYCGYV